jgi:D-glycero-alpha-D-manno-heptose-7-phosphate kinase
MSTTHRCLKQFLEENPIKSSAPCRIDSGGTWDIKAFALPLEGAEPTTVNLALNLRTYVTLLPYKPGWVKISSENFHAQETYPLDLVPFNSQFGLMFAVVSFFGLHGVEIAITSMSPVKAGLGGSSAAAVAAIKAFSHVNALLHEKELGKRDILHLAFHLEDAVNMGMCGLQDQGASVFGGVNKWVWNYSRKVRPFERESILNVMGQRELSKRILVAYSGSTHLSAKINRLWIEEFLKGNTRSSWVELNSIVSRFAQHLRERQWKAGAEELRNEVTIRKEVTPQAFTPIITRLIQESEEMGCGARFAGAGGGGTVWALGEIDNIQVLREKWAAILKGTKKGRILDCAVDPTGVRDEGKDA